MTAVAESISAATSIVLEDVTRTFDDGLRAVDGVNLSIAPGQFVALLGPSGCGKSTLLRMIAGLDRPTGGRIELTPGAAIAPAESSLAYVFQDPHLLPWRNVLRNVALPLELRGIGKHERLEIAAEAVEQVGLSEFTHHYPAQLSGGMRMRVSLARALVTNPSLLLLDEPFAALDELTRHHLDEQLQALWQARGMTVLFVTHSTAEAAFLARRAVVFSPRPARVVLDRVVDLPYPRTPQTRGQAAYAAETRTLYEALEG